LFNPRAKLDPDILSDDKIFIMLQKGLKPDYVQWMKGQRAYLLEKLKVRFETKYRIIRKKLKTTSSL
jgi:RecA/RadA recombinase